jgi:hypothetical protein
MQGRILVVDHAFDTFPEVGHAMQFSVQEITPYTSLIGFMIGLPTALATYYQIFKTRQEAKAAREGELHSMNCLEFVDHNGDCINLIPLETLHSIPKPGDVVLLPGDGSDATGGDLQTVPEYGTDAETAHLPGAYRVERVEHIFTPPEKRGRRPREARLTKTVMTVQSLHTE